MTPRHLSFAAALLAAGLAALPAARAADARPIRVLLLDGQNNHNWRATTPVLKKQLESAKCFRVDVSSHLKPGDKPGTVETVPFPPDLSKYDVLVSNYNGASWPKAFNDSVEQALREGKIALVIVHAANNAFTGWREYNEMIGMGWRGNSFGDRLVVDEGGKPQRLPAGKGPGAGHGSKHAFKLTVRDAEHPVTRGMPAEWQHTADELYHGMRGPIKNVHVLATAYSDKRTGGTGEHEPILWTVRYGNGRVFHTTLGHDLDGINCAGFLGSLQRGTEWAATGKVTLPLPANFPTADQARPIGGGKKR